MIDPQFKTPQFTLHPDINLAEFKLEIGTKSLLKNPYLIEDMGPVMVFETRTKIFDTWVRTRARFKTNESKVRFWWWMIVGDVTMSAPLIDVSSVMEVRHPPFGVVSLSRPARFLQGQGSTLHTAEYDFSAKMWNISPVTHALLPTDFAPLSPNKTGGNWRYMGYDFSESFPTLIDARRELYAIGNYAGHFLTNDGDWLLERDRPDLVARSHIHENSKDPGWIHYTDPSAHWRDELAGGFNNQDEQHLCLWSPLAAAARTWPADEGFQMLIEAASCLFERQIPDRPKGTTQHNSGAERAQGRILQGGLDLLTSLLHPVRVDTSFRVQRRWEIDKAAAGNRINKGLPRFAQFGDNPGNSPSEVGIHFAGLRKIEAFGGGGPDLENQLRAAATYCFESFLDWDIPGDRVLAVPYWRYYDGSPWGGPSSTGHFCWLAAISHDPRNDSERDKLKRIYDLGENVDDRFRSVS